MTGFGSRFQTALHRWLDSYVRLARRRTGWLLGLFVLVAAGALIIALRLGLNTDMAEMLPADHPGVLSLRRLSVRQRSSTSLVLLMSAPERAATERFAKALRPALATLVPGTFTDIQWQPDSEIADHAQRWGWLYASIADLEEAETLLDRIILSRTGMSVDLEGDPEDELRALRKRLDDAKPAPPPPAFAMERDGRHYLGVILWRRGGGLATRGDHEALADARRVVEALNPASFHPDLQVEYTGPIAISLEEYQALANDLTAATTVCSLLVLLAIYLYFRRIDALWVIGTPAFFGLLIALAIARPIVGDLNGNTAFLLSIILGNGINAPIILLGRYAEERRRQVAQTTAGLASGHPARSSRGEGEAHQALPDEGEREGSPLKEDNVEAALGVALRETLLGTVTAMAAAAIAYGSLRLTTLRGLNQFGLIGGVGMLVVWVSTFLIVPPMIFWIIRRWPGSLVPKPPAALWRVPFVWIGRLAANRPRLLLGTGAMSLVVAGLLLASFMRDPLEWDLRKLRSSDEKTAKAWERMYVIGIGALVSGYIATDGVILVDQANQADTVAEALRRQDQKLGDKRMLRTVRTLGSVLPDAQAEKLTHLARIRQKIDRYRNLLSDDEWKEVAKWRPPESLRVIGPADLPKRIRDAFTEVSGGQGRMVGIDADPSRFDGNNGRDLIRLSRALEVDALGKHWVAASPSTLFAGMLEVIVRDGPPMTLAALLGVSVLVGLAFGPTGALPVLATVFVGLTWLGAVMALAGIKVNFLNFVALPITLGVGADYAANLWARLRREDAARMGEVVTDTGSAVALCSATTIIGYNSLLLARNRALQSFGLLAGLGEVTCLVAVLLLLPASMRLARRLGARQPVQAPARDP